MRTTSTARPPSRSGPGRLLLFRGVLVVLTAGLFSVRGSEAIELTDELQVFGHLTQSYGLSDRGSILGATEGGTTNLRKIALQFRWEKTEKDTVVIQFSHERRGDDIFNPTQEGVEIDWAFYERRLLANTSVKIGRLNVPLGIYNEIRDVGTLLPFFGLPVSFYAGVLSTAETVDGMSLLHTFAPRSEWALDAELYMGGWDTVQQRVDPNDRFGLVNFEARAEDGVGVQLWLETPVQGLRVGAGALTFQLDGPNSIPGGRDRWDTYHASIDYSDEMWVFRAEARRWRFEQDFGLFAGETFSFPAHAGRDGFYAQLGAWITQNLGVWAQFEKTGLSAGMGLPAPDPLHRDRALSINYRFRPDLMLKGEVHFSRTRFPLGEGSVLPSDSVLTDVNWGILSLSVSF